MADKLFPENAPLGAMIRMRDTPLTVVGVLLSLAIGQLGDLPIRIDLGGVLLADGAAAAVGIFFGLYPALKASRLSPIDALRAE